MESNPGEWVNPGTHLTPIPIKPLQTASPSLQHKTFHATRPPGRRVQKINRLTHQAQVKRSLTETKGRNVKRLRVAGMNGPPLIQAGLLFAGCRAIIEEQRKIMPRFQEYRPDQPPTIKSQRTTRTRDKRQPHPTIPIKRRRTTQWAIHPAARVEVEASEITDEGVRGHTHGKHIQPAQTQSPREG